MIQALPNRKAIVYFLYGVVVAVSTNSPIWLFRAFAGPLLSTTIGLIVHCLVS